MLDDICHNDNVKSSLREGQTIIIVIITKLKPGVGYITGAVSRSINTRLISIKSDDNRLWKSFSNKTS